MNLVEELSNTLREKSMILATAESCTGGMIASAITDLAGSSDIFDRGFVTYSNTSKQEMLGVSEDILNDHGAVSAECAKAMVEGALNNSSANIAVSVTGIAGPGGGSADKPVGLVYMGICVAGKPPKVIQHNFYGSRADIRENVCIAAFEALIKEISENE